MYNHNPKHSFSTAIILFIGFIIFSVITIISFIDYGVTASIFLNLFLALSCLLCSYLMYKKSKQKCNELIKGQRAFFTFHDIIFL